MMNNFNTRNLPDEVAQSINESDIIFDLSSPNKKNPMIYEMESVIALLKIIKDNIELLDPLDLEP
jgi:tRNA U34 5-methylaminomethyl-2-thiouridine-forming methyltransferase MnmC